MHEQAVVILFFMNFTAADQQKSMMGTERQPILEEGQKPSAMSARLNVRFIDFHSDGPHQHLDGNDQAQLFLVPVSAPVQDAL